VNDYLFTEDISVSSAETCDIRDLCEVYGVTDPAQRDHLMELVREGRKLGWWQAYDLPYGTYLGLESDAASISVFHATIIPGLMF
jgi:hypothetical protein